MIWSRRRRSMPLTLDHAEAVAVGVGVVAQHARRGPLSGVSSSVVAGVVDRHRRVVDAGDGDGDGGRVGAAVAVVDRVAERVGGGLAAVRSRTGRWGRR